MRLRKGKATEWQILRKLSAELTYWDGPFTEQGARRVLRERYGNLPEYVLVRVTYERVE